MYYQKSTEQSNSGPDEVEDLFELIKDVKSKFPEVQAVSSGAIFSDYQRLRVENVCNRHELMSLAYLWRRD
jgi:diphthine-ammonia ligase